MSEPIIVRDLRTLRNHMWEWRGLGQSIGFVPTMGALHEGHLSLVRLAQLHARKVVASIYVNPTQFAPGEDFDSYPRQEASDIEKLASVGCDLIYIPDAQSMYAPTHSTAISVGGVANGLETDHRPHFFNGVALIVLKLLNRVFPDVAIFGEKDYQQLAVIRQCVRDLDVPIRILGAPIARDEHGLALSSRNAYFDADGLAIARQLNAIMYDTARKLRMGHNIELSIEMAKSALLSAGFESIDYVTPAHADKLTPLLHGQVMEPARLFIAAHCKGVRLIDNCAV